DLPRQGQHLPAALLRDRCVGAGGPEMAAVLDWAALPDARGHGERGLALRLSGPALAEHSRTRDVRMTRRPLCRAPLPSRDQQFQHTRMTPLRSRISMMRF